MIGFDKDPAALEIARERLTGDDWPEITLLQRSFAEIAKGNKAGTIDGLLADIGVSSLQLDDAARGFSFQGGDCVHEWYGAITLIQVQERGLSW